jgi:hypothetical protein
LSNSPPPAPPIARLPWPDTPRPLDTPRLPDTPRPLDTLRLPHLPRKQMSPLRWRDLRPAGSSQQR